MGEVVVGVVSAVPVAEPVAASAAAVAQRADRVGVVTQATVRLGESQWRVQGRPPRDTLSRASKGAEGGA